MNHVRLYSGTCVREICYLFLECIDSVPASLERNEMNGLHLMPRNHTGKNILEYRYNTSKDLDQN
jgi:hypothetical protein